MNGPAIRNGELDDDGHCEEPKRGKACRQAQGQKDWQHNFGEGNHKAVAAGAGKG